MICRCGEQFIITFVKETGDEIRKKILDRLNLIVRPKTDDSETVPGCSNIDI